MDFLVYVTISELWDLSPTVPPSVVSSGHAAAHACRANAESCLGSHTKVFVPGMGYKGGSMALVCLGPSCLVCGAAADL